jgi:hypothetical protein
VNKTDSTFFSGNSFTTELQRECRVLVEMQMIRGDYEQNLENTNWNDLNFETGGENTSKSSGDEDERIQDALRAKLAELTEFIRTESKEASKAVLE